MPGRYKNREFIKEIKEGNEDILLYLYKKYYGDMKAIYRSYNIAEEEIPALAASVIVKIWMEIRRNDFSENIDLISYLLNTTKENSEKFAAERKAEKKHKFKVTTIDKAPQEIIAECVNVLDAESRRALQGRYADNQSIEQVAAMLKTDVASAHDFLHKAFTQLSAIVKIRMDYA